MKPVVWLLFAAAVGGRAADFWESEPFTQWTSKEIHKLETASPWAKSFWVSSGPPSGTFDNSVILTVSWQSARPLREALAIKRFAGQAGTAAEAKEIIEKEPEFYQILVTAKPRNPLLSARGGKIFVRDASLIVSGKFPIPAEDVRTGGDEKAFEILLQFPRRVALTLADKSVDFFIRMGPFVVRRSFRLKDMVIRGKLEL